MIRRWWVRPDEILLTEEGELETVSRELSIKAFVDAEAHIAHFGGTFNIVSMRQPTGLPGEHVTIAIMFEWRDAPVTKERAEVASQMVPTPASMSDEAPAGVEVPAQIAEEDDGVVRIDPADPADVAPSQDVEIVSLEPAPAVPDVITGEDGAPEEDVSSIPRHRREKAIA